MSNLIGVVYLFGVLGIPRRSVFQNLLSLWEKGRGEGLKTLTRSSILLVTLIGALLVLLCGSARGQQVPEAGNISTPTVQPAAEPAPAHDSAIVLKAERERRIKELIKTAGTGEVAARCAALRKLARLRCTEAIPTIIEALRAEDEQVRAVAVDALAVFADPTTLDMLGSLATKDPSPRVAGSALRALARFDARAAIPFLLAALDSDYEGVRYHASRVLTEQTGFDFGFRAEADLQARTAAVRQWRDWWTRNSTNTPIQWWLEGLKDASPANRSAAARKLAETGDMQAAIPSLIDALSDDVSAVRYHASRALEQLTLLTMDFDPTAPKEERDIAIARWRAWWNENKNRPRSAWLTLALKEPSPLIRARAAAELGKTGDKQFVLPLANALLDTEPIVRNAAAAALTAITGLPAGIGMEDEVEARQKAVQWWGEWWELNRNREKRDWLAHALLNDPTPLVRAAAVRSLSAFPDHLTVPLLFYGLEDDSDVVRTAAFASLRHITGMAFDYRPEAPPAVRASELARIKEWWYKHGANYVFPPSPSSR